MILVSYVLLTHQHHNIDLVNISSHDTTRNIHPIQVKCAPTNVVPSYQINTHQVQHKTRGESDIIV